MDPTVQINERVDVVATFQQGAGERLTCMPRRMKFRGRDIELTILGMRHPTAQGQRMIHVFEMSDGANDYRLEFDAERLTWMLVSVIAGRDV